METEVREERRCHTLLPSNMEEGATSQEMLTISRGRQGSQGKKTGSPQSLQKGTQPYLHLDFRPLHTSDLQRTNSYWIKPFRFWWFVTAATGS